MSAEFPVQTLPKAAAEARGFVFDFSQFPEILAGDTLSNGGLSAPAVSGLTLGTPTLTTAVNEDDPDNPIPAGQAVLLPVSGGTAGQTYLVEVRATTAGGSVLVVRGYVAVDVTG